MRAAALDEQKKLDDARSEYGRIQKMRDERQRDPQPDQDADREVPYPAGGPGDAEGAVGRPGPGTPGDGALPQHAAVGPGRHHARIDPGAVAGAARRDAQRPGADAERRAAVPACSAAGSHPGCLRRPGVDDIDLCDVVREAPYSLLGESYRRCRTNLELSAGEPFKTLLVASGQAGRRQDLDGVQSGGGVCRQVREGAADRRQPAAAEPAHRLPAGGVRAVLAGSG